MLNFAEWVQCSTANQLLVILISISPQISEGDLNNIKIIYYKRMTLNACKPKAKLTLTL